MLIGNLGRDSETRFTTNNVEISRFSLATTHSYKNREGNWTDETTWHNVVAFNLSDFYKDSLKRGRKFYVEGRLTKRDYTDKDGNKRYSTDVIADKLIPLDSKESFADNTQYSENMNNESNSSADTNQEEDDLPF
jgi:single-strand DNA-binding protein